MEEREEQRPARPLAPADSLRRAMDQMVAERNVRATVYTVLALRSKGIEVLLLKGASVAAALYGNEPRPSSDVDLLVHPRSQRASAAVLCGLGYSESGAFSHATEWRSASGLPIDLHRTLPRTTCGPGRVWEVLEEHRLDRPLGTPPVMIPMLDDAALAAHLAIHATQGHPRPLEDMARAVVQFDEATWTGAVEVSRSLGTQSSLAWALDQVDGGEALRRRLALPALDRADLPARSIGDGGIWRLLVSPVHWRQRLRSFVPALRLVRRRMWPSAERGEPRRKLTR